MSYIESAQWLNRAIYIVKYIVCEIYSFYLFLLLIMYIYIYSFNFAKSFINFNPDVGLSKIIQTKPNQNSLYIQNFAENLGLYRDYRKLAQLGFKSTSTISSLWRHCNILRYKVMSFTCTRFCSSSIFTLAQRFL